MTRTRAITAEFIGRLGLGPANLLGRLRADIPVCCPYHSKGASSAHGRHPSEARYDESSDVVPKYRRRLFSGAV